MRALKAFALGAAAFGIVAYVAAAVLAVIVTVAEQTLHVGLGPVVFVAVEPGRDASTTTFGAGLALIALAGGCANAAAAIVLARRRRNRSIA